MVNSNVLDEDLVNRSILARLVDHRYASPVRIIKLPLAGNDPNTWSNANYPLTTNGPIKSATAPMTPTNQFFRLIGN